MPDRDKVIKALECCIAYYVGYDLTGHDRCPYNGRNDGKGCNTLYADAIELLKEQKAVEPYITGNGESFETAETWWYECGNCNKPIDPNDKFCRHCGRKVKWE